MFDRTRNLLRINKLYGLIRDLIEKPKLRGSVGHWIAIFNTALQIKEVQEMLQGYKTYVVAALMAAVTVAHAMGFIDDETYKTLMGLLAAGGATTVAAKINRMNPPK